MKEIIEYQKSKTESKENNVELIEAMSKLNIADENWQIDAHNVINNSKRTALNLLLEQIKENKLNNSSIENEYEYEYYNDIDLDQLKLFIDTYVSDLDEAFNKEELKVIITLLHDITKNQDNSSELIYHVDWNVILNICNDIFIDEESDKYEIFGEYSKKLVSSIFTYKFNNKNINYISDFFCKLVKNGRQDIIIELLNEDALDSILQDINISNYWKIINFITHDSWEDYIDNEENKKKFQNLLKNFSSLDLVDIPDRYDDNSELGSDKSESHDDGFDDLKLENSQVKRIESMIKILELMNEKKESSLKDLLHKFYDDIIDTLIEEEYIFSVYPILKDNKLSYEELNNILSEKNELNKSSSLICDRLEYFKNKKSQYEKLFNDDSGTFKTFKQLLYSELYQEYRIINMIISNYRELVENHAEKEDIDIIHEKLTTTNSKNSKNENYFSIINSLSTTYYKLGTDSFYKDNYKEAIVCFEKAINLSNNFKKISGKTSYSQELSDSENNYVKHIPFLVRSCVEANDIERIENILKNNKTVMKDKNDNLLKWQFLNYAFEENKTTQNLSNSEDDSDDDSHKNIHFFGAVKKFQKNIFLT